jgi:hypothetical protein
VERWRKRQWHLLALFRAKRSKSAAKVSLRGEECKNQRVEEKDLTPKRRRVRLSGFFLRNYSPTKSPLGARMNDSDNGRNARHPPSSMVPSTRTLPFGLESQST